MKKKSNAIPLANVPAQRDIAKIQKENPGAKPITVVDPKDKAREQAKPIIVPGKRPVPAAKRK